ncbi:hypothetical protein ACQ4PT_057951 [Festuca glaucescens]
MRDQWLPRASGLKITTLKKNSRKRWVNQLIIEAQSVSDRVAWHYETNGVFSVRSAYKLALQLKHRNRDIVSNSANADGNRPLWNCIWKAQVPPKVRVFAWKLATNSLPTKANKFRRKLEVCEKCDICGMESEDAYHAVNRCTKAAGLRHALRDHWKLPPEHTFRYSGNDWLLILLNQLDDSSSSRVLLLFWRAWHLRNNVIHENGKEPISRSVNFLVSYATAHENLEVPVNIKGKTPFPCSASIIRKVPVGASTAWEAPPLCWIKLNTDASFTSKDRAGGAGAVAIDHHGNIMFAACSPIPRCADAIDAEAKAALRVIELVKSMGYSRIILELHCAALSSDDQDRSNQWVTIDTAKAMLRSLEEHRLCHTRRDGNKVADALAKTAASAGSYFWLSHLPDFVSDLVTQDMYPTVIPSI